MLKKEDVSHVADLARLELKDDELRVFGAQLAAVFELFGKLENVKTENVEETSQVTGLENITRSDEIKNFRNLTDASRNELLSNVPKKSEQEIIVPRVIGGR